MTTAKLELRGAGIMMEHGLAASPAFFAVMRALASEDDTPPGVRRAPEPQHKPFTVIQGGA